MIFNNEKRNCFVKKFFFISNLYFKFCFELIEEFLEQKNDHFTILHFTKI